MRTTLISTIFNEEKTINKFIDSIIKQTLLPDEVIIVDGGSKDSTEEILDRKKKELSKKTNFIFLVKKGNRSVGRNEAIKNSSGDIILSADAGCILHKNWIKNIIAPFNDKSVDAVAGYYRGVFKNNFEKSLIPYVLIMPDKVNESDFLPATRSMAFRKSIWKNAKGFDEKLFHNEDFAFANKLKKNNSKITFVKNAIVNWIPRKNIKDTFIMFFRFALGDIQSGNFREKVVYIFLRYMLALYLLFIGVIFHILIFWIFYLTLILLYVLWSIKKNYKYVNSYQAFFFLPLIQFISDAAVILGSSVGLLQKFSLKSLINYVLENKSLSLIVLIYIGINLFFIEWGIPNLSHPFNYHMDEWHFAQAIRAFLRFGTGSVSGAASIPLYHIVSSIVFLAPFYLLHIINPYAIKNSIDNISQQHTLFEILRLHTLLYGVLSVLFLYKILKKNIKSFPVIFTATFAFAPLWIFLSNFYKYDITLTFWIIATIYFILRFYENEKFSNFIFAGITCGLALSTKFTAFPLFLGYLLSYFIFTKQIRLKEIAVSILITALVFLFIGIPDTIFGKGSYSTLLYANLVQDPQGGGNFNLGYPAWFYLMFVQYPAIFGYFLVGLTYLSTLYWTILFTKETINKKISKYKVELFFYLTFVLFFVGLLSFNLGGTGNRALLVLPFMILLSSLFIKKVIINRKSFWIVILILGVFLQTVQSYTWNSVKLDKNPRVDSSNWLIKNISPNTLIGIENIPIYQNLPDVVLKEFYLKEHDKLAKTRFRYSVISSSSKTLPKVVIVSQDYDEVNYVKISPKKDLVNRLKKDNYKKIMVFYPELRYYNLFSDKITFLLIYPIPLTVSIYEK